MKDEGERTARRGQQKFHTGVVSLGAVGEWG